MECETGLSLLGRLTDRLPLEHLFGTGRGAPPCQLTGVEAVLSASSQQHQLLTSFCSDVICNVVLPPAHRGVYVGGCGTSLVLINGNHNLVVKDIAEEMQTRIRQIAEDHYRSLPPDRRKTDRLTSTEQWYVVREALERLLVMEAYDPDALETSLISLKGILLSNNHISCILVDSINTFYHQVHGETGVNHSAYMRRLRGHLTAALKDSSPALRVLYTQLQFFNTEDFKKADRTEPDERIVLAPVIGNASYRFRCGQLELEWPLK